MTKKINKDESLKIKKGDCFDDLRQPSCPVKATVIAVIRSENLFVLKFWVKHRNRWCFDLVSQTAIDIFANAKRFNRRKP